MWRHVNRSALKKLTVSNRTFKRVMILSVLGVMMVHQSQGLISESLTYDDVLMARVNRAGIEVEN